MSVKKECKLLLMSMEIGKGKKLKIMKAQMGFGFDG